MKYIIIDSMSLCYRAKYAMKGVNLSNPDSGAYTEVVYNFCNQILFIANKFGCSNFIFCWDSGKYFRKNIYPTYKQKKKALTKDEKLFSRITHPQFSEIRRKLLPALGFKNIFIQTGMEADDVIASIVFKNKSTDFVIVSTDEDLFQLLRSNILHYSPVKKVGTNLSKFKTNYGIEPNLWSDVKSIAGCVSDNVKGVDGVGEKTAIKYIKGEVTSGKRFDDIKKNPDLIKFNKQLVTLPYKGTNVFPIRPEQLYISNFIKTFNRYKFESFLTQNRLKQWELSFNLK